MKYTGPVRFIFLGHPRLCLPHTSRSRLFLQQAMDRMGPDKAYSIETLPDGTEITVSSLGGIKQVWIKPRPDEYDENIRGYVLQTTLNEVDGDTGIRYLPMSIQYENVWLRNYQTGDDEEWSGGNYVASFGPNIWIKNQETETTHAVKYAFYFTDIHDDNTKYQLSFDADWKLYLDDTVVDLTFDGDTTIVKIVASPDGRRICVLHDVDEQISSDVQYYEYDVALTDNNTDVSLSLVNSPATVELTEDKSTTIYGDTGTTTINSDGYAWTVTKTQSPAGCTYSGSPLTSDVTIVTSDSQTTKVPINRALEFTTDVEYLNNNYELLLAKTDFSDYHIYQKISDVTTRYTVCSSSLETADDTAPTDCCTTWCSDLIIPAGTILHQKVCEEDYHEAERNDIIYQHRGQVSIGDLTINAYEEDAYYHQYDYKGPTSTSPWVYSTPEEQARIIIRMGLVWSVRHSACIYMEMECEDPSYTVSSWPTNTKFINRIVKESVRDGREVLYEGTQGTNQMLWWGQQDHGGSYPSEQRYAWNVVSFFWQDYSVWRLNDYEPNSSHITIRSRYRHTDANSEVLYVDLTIEGEVVEHAWDPSGEGADDEMNRLIEDGTFTSFTAI